MGHRYEERAFKSFKKHRYALINNTEAAPQVKQEIAEEKEQAE